MTKEQYLSAYPYQVVRKHNEPNDQYEASLCCGSFDECQAKAMIYRNIFRGSKTDKFIVKHNTYEA